MSAVLIPRPLPVAESCHRRKKSPAAVRATIWHSIPSWADCFELCASEWTHERQATKFCASELVDDEDSVRDSVKMLLSIMGYAILTASSGEEAMRIARQHEGPIHLLLTDLSMPRMTGRELAEELTGIKPDIRVLYMSGYNDDAIVQQNVVSDKNNLLQKPFSLPSLRTLVRKALES